MYFSFFQNASDRYLGEVFFDTSLCVHCVSLVALTYRGLCSAFISAVWVAFPLLTKLCVHKDFKQHGRVFAVLMQMGKHLQMLKTRLAGMISFLFLFFFWSLGVGFQDLCCLYFLTFRSQRVSSYSSHSVPSSRLRTLS